MYCGTSLSWDILIQTESIVPKSEVVLDSSRVSNITIMSSDSTEQNYYMNLSQCFVSSTLCMLASKQSRL